jgi:MoaA/NifB/PqqE/SkfB family radical SAM enzyme
MIPMSPVSRLGTGLWIRAAEITNRTLVLPLLIFYPTSRCNSRCLSCDWWKASGADDLSLDEISTLTRSLDTMGTRVVAFSGGEPLLREDVFEIARRFREREISLHLLTSGVLLYRHARHVASSFTRVTISLDATTGPLYRKVRGVDALEMVEEGVARLRAEAPSLPISARATLSKANFRELPSLIDKALELGLEGISFLAADVSSGAFGRTHSPASADLVLDSDEILEFSRVVEATLDRHAERFRSGFIAESPEKLRRLPRYYKALAGDGPFPPVDCNAPWFSAVVEANGAVRPCFFHDPIGNVRQAPLDRILRRDLPAFRGRLRVAEDPLCQRCVCSIRAGARSSLWQ